MQNNNFFQDRLQDMFLSADRNVSLRYTPFLDCFEIAQLENIISRFNKLYPDTSYYFWGGYENAKSKILCVYNSYIPCSNEDFPLKILEFRYNSNFSKLTHRDFLGALMSLNIKRNCIGDIIVEDGITQVIVSSTVAEIILNEIDCVGRVGVKVSLIDDVTLEVSQKFKDISGTISSLRLDCIISMILNVSRERSAQIIKSKAVSLNYIDVLSPSICVKLNDIVSVRGYGKFVVSFISTKLTKKGRLHILVKKYL